MCPSHSGKNERQLDSAQNSDLDDKRIKLSGQKVPLSSSVLHGCSEEAIEVFIT